jgi:hypothetical protein
MERRRLRAGGVGGGGGQGGGGGGGSGAEGHLFTTGTTFRSSMSRACALDAAASAAAFEFEEGEEGGGADIDKPKALPPFGFEVASEPAAGAEAAALGSRMMSWQPRSGAPLAASMRRFMWGAGGCWGAAEGDGDAGARDASLGARVGAGANLLSHFRSS